MKMEARRLRRALSLAIAACTAPHTALASNACLPGFIVDGGPWPGGSGAPIAGGNTNPGTIRPGIGGTNPGNLSPGGSIPPRPHPTIPCYHYDTRDADIQSVSVPETMEAGKSYPIRVVLANNGMEVWSPTSGHRLASRSQNGDIWGVETVTPQVTARNGNIITLDFTVIAPALSGTYEFLWQMRKGDSEWFGEATQAYSVSVVGAEGAIPTSPDFVARGFVYDAQQRLCKVIEPETGVTIIDYDVNGNIAWTASGLQLPSLSNCNRSEASASGRRVDRRYDQRNRIASISYPDGRGDQTFEYTPDGLRQRVESVNRGESGKVVNTYLYNRRRLLTAESQSVSGLPSLDVGYGFDENGNRASVRYPTGYVVQYTNNALGQARSVRSTNGDVIAEAIRHHPSGAIESLRYGNGLTRSVAFNARQLPEQIRDSNASSLGYSYDAGANITSIADGVRGASFDRVMSYDLDNRLVSASSESFAKQKEFSFSYDGLDNITASKLKGTVRDISYWYDQRNRLTNVVRLGITTVGISYDAQGNMSRRNGQIHEFDLDNRLRNVPGVESYLYDADGRRVSVLTESGSLKRSFYGTEGALLLEQKLDGGHFEHVYIGGALFASREPGGMVYLHSDTLGTPMAKTGASGQLLERRAFEPYGMEIGSAVDGVGFTGHLMDSSTGLTYMQQRYYDPHTGRFVSADPLSASQIDGSNFNRYAYAKNNPYKYHDPDGEFGLVGAGIGMGIEFALQMATAEGSFSERLMNVDLTDIAVAGAVGAVTGGLGGRAAIQASKGLISAGKAVRQTAKAGAATSALGSGAKDVLNGEAPDGGRMLASGAVGGLTSSIGSRIGLARITSLERVGSNAVPGGPNIAAATRSMLRPGEVPVSAGQTVGQVIVDNVGATADDRIERWLSERAKDD